MHPSPTKCECVISNQFNEAASVIIVKVRANNGPELRDTSLPQEFKDNFCVVGTSAINQDSMGISVFPLRDDNAVSVAKIENVYFDAVEHPKPPQTRDSSADFWFRT